MVDVSIGCLIYRSTRYADAVYESIIEFTPMVLKQKAEFFFVANDPTRELLDHLRAKGYPHYENYNEKRSREELFRMGYATPEYIHRVYRGWNKAITSSKGKTVVLVNSDNLFSPNWLEHLLEFVSPERIVCSKLVERWHPRHGVFRGAYRGEFGANPDQFRKKEFLEFCAIVSKRSLEDGGAFMPCAFYKDIAIQAGLYPEGNLAGKSFDDVVAYGDQAFFQRLAKLGVRHVTALNSIVYHFKEGEMDEVRQGELRQVGPAPETPPQHKTRLSALKAFARKRAPHAYNSIRSARLATRKRKQDRETNTS